MRLSRESSLVQSPKSSDDSIAAMVSLRADVDVILDVPVLKSEATPADPTEDMVFAALFTTSTAPPPPPRERAKRHQYI